MKIHPTGNGADLKKNANATGVAIAYTSSERDAAQGSGGSSSQEIYPETLNLFL